MGSRVTEKERLKHKVPISLNDDLYYLLLDEARVRNLAPSTIARLAFAEGMPEIRKIRMLAARGNAQPEKG